jgi:hypothetical protein
MHTVAEFIMDSFASSRLHRATIALFDMFNVGVRSRNFSLGLWNDIGILIRLAYEQLLAGLITTDGILNIFSW